MVRAAAATLFAGVLSACAAMPPQGITPYAPAPDMVAVLAAQQKLGARPTESLSPEQARVNPSIADAVRAVQSARGQDIIPMPVGSARNIQLDGAAGPIAARVYTPAGAAPGPLPMVVYFHGGGWVIATIDTYDASARALANGAGAVVVSVEYRKGPENRFPAAHDDAVAAYRWVLANASALGGDPRRVAVAGESAGGNLAINVAIAARDQRLPMPVHQLLVYPVAGTDLAVQSARENARAMPLSTAGLEWFIRYYTNGPRDLQDPRLDVVGRADLQGLPPATLILAQIDPLRSGGEMLAQKLSAAGVQTDTRTYTGTTHEFFGTGAVVPLGRQAVAYGSERLRQSFAATAPVAEPRARRVRATGR